MKTRKLLQGFMTVAFIGASVPGLHAQGYKVFVMGGGSSLFDKEYYTVYGAAFGSTYKTGAAFAVGAEIPLIPMLSAEGSFGIARNNLAVTNFANSATPNNEIGYAIQDQRISGDVVAHPPRSLKGVQPYLVAGLELDRFSATSSGAAVAQSKGFNGVPNAVLLPDNELGFNFGGGLDIKATRMIAIRLDARDHIFKSPTFGLPSAATSTFTAYYPISGHVQNLEYSAGIVFRFGK